MRKCDWVDVNVVEDGYKTRYQIVSLSMSVIKLNDENLGDCHGTRFPIMIDQNNYLHTSISQPYESIHRTCPLQIRVRI